MVKIFIDPGHGGTDPGAAGNGIQEKNIALRISSGLRDILISEYENVSVLMSRTGDQTVSLNARTNAANNWGADFYLSIHINAGGGTGFESYVYPGEGRPTITYQEIIHRNVLAQVKWDNRGMKKSNLHVLRESKMQALLTENGFIDTSSDAQKLKDSDFIEKLARGHANGIAEAFHLQKKISTQPPPSSPNRLYKVQIGAFQDKTNAEMLMKKAEAIGFKTYLKKEKNLYKVQIGVFKERKNADALMNRAKSLGLDAVIVIG